MFTSSGPMQLPLNVPAGIEIAQNRPRQHNFSPYEMNGGTSVGISGKDFCVIAADTRLSTGYSILSRKISRATQLTSRSVVATGGCRTDVITLHKLLKIRMIQYKTNHKREMHCPSIGSSADVYLKTKSTPSLLTYSYTSTIYTHTCNSANAVKYFVL